MSQLLAFFMSLMASILLECLSAAFLFCWSLGFLFYLNVCNYFLVFGSLGFHFVLNVSPAFWFLGLLASILLECPELLFGFWVSWLPISTLANINFALCQGLQQHVVNNF